MGVPLDAARTARCLAAIREAAPGLGLVAAGGLSAENLAELLSPLLPEWAGVSIDAEGRLRDAGDNLDMAAAVAYLQAALELLG